MQTPQNKVSARVLKARSTLTVSCSAASCLDVGAAAVASSTPFDVGAAAVAGSRGFGVGAAAVASSRGFDVGAAVVVTSRGLAVVGVVDAGPATCVAGLSDGSCLASADRAGLGALIVASGVEGVSVASAGAEPVSADLKCVSCMRRINKPIETGILHSTNWPGPKWS